MGAAVSEQAPAEPHRTAGALARVRAALAVIAVVAASLAAGLVALGLYEREEDLGIASVNLSVSLPHRGALDLYVPVVDWGARFPAVQAPVRLHVDVRRVDRDAVQRLAAGGSVDVEAVRAKARDALASYIRALLAVVFAVSLAGGIVAALVVRSRHVHRLRVLVAAGAGTALALTLALWALLPPRGPIDRPQYYAHGADVPRALEALERVRRSSARLDEELNAQLVGLAKLVVNPAARTPVDAAPRITLASDLHNNVLAVPVLERAAQDGPVLFTGDMTDRGSPLEQRLVRQVVRTGRPFVFVAGNHDSDSLRRTLVRDGAIVLDKGGRRLPTGRRGPEVVEVAGLRVAGYGDPRIRLAAQRYDDRYDYDFTPEQQNDFATWLRSLSGRVDVVMVHNIRLAETALQELAASPPATPIVFVTGHSHRAQLRRSENVTVIDSGTIGAGGTNNLTKNLPMSLAVLRFARGPFNPLAVDLVSINPRTGSATAQRERLDEEPASG